MKRRAHGANLDDGVALASAEEFRLLFIDGRPEVRSALEEWLADDEQEAMLFGGQIGTGKTTLLNKIVRSRGEAPVIRMRFDTDCIDATEGGYVVLCLGQVLRACVARGVPADGCGVAVKDFAALGRSDWATIADAMTKPPGNLALANQMRDLAAQVTPNSKQVRRACGTLLDRLAERVKRTPILVADGVDKFDPTTADYFSLKDTLAFLAERKTLFEANAVHLFRELDYRAGIRKLFIGGFPDDLMKTVFAKRLGPYAPLYQKAFSHLTEYAGGNVRQGLRLLNGYYFYRTQMRNDHAAAVALACHRVATDLLSVPFGRFPSDVFSVVKRDGFIEGSLLADQVTALAANEAVYRNWLFLTAEPTVSAPTRWPARLNPLIEIAIDWKADAPLTPEEQAVRKWARERHVSPVGLNVPTNERGEPDWDGFWEEIKSSSSSEGESLSILRLLDEIGAGLFGVERRDRIIVTYKKRGNLDTVRDFLVGKANTHEPFSCVELTLAGGDGRQPVQELIARLASRNTQTIYSIDLSGDWTDAQLRDLEHRRDMFDNLQVLMWIQEDDLKEYLRFWQQLRQLFRIYRLEEDLWRGITPEEVAADIEVLEQVSAGPEPEGVRRLRSVLEFLRKESKRA
ncbi:MAG: hypothetical protein LAO51_15920 [Acidobacteriia bacterium]|nr:hypothetical protein [Terriglobia bacterium]